MTEEKNIQGTTALTEITQESGIVMPAVTVEEAKKAWASYQELKLAVRTADDIQLIQGKQFLKKSYWRKIATFFNLSVNIVSEHEEDDKNNGNRAYHFVCRATAPNGRSAIGAGSCDLYDKAEYDQVKKLYVDRYGKPATPVSTHFARSVAETRAWNRSVSNLVGGGEVSADEMPMIDHAPATQQKTYAQRPKTEEGECGTDHSTLRVLTVNKEGKNKGRTFTTCKDCGYFNWES